MQFTVTFIVLAIAGILDAGYLIYKHYFEKKPLVCPIGYDCNAVVESKWGTIFGIRNEILGLLFYMGMFVGILATIFFPMWSGTMLLFLLIGSGIGLAFSIFLTILQIYVIKNICFYCVISAVITLLLFVNALALY
jgi:uncharacterized membrane protein